MITIQDREYEPDQTKLFWLATHTAVLLAGEMVLHASVCPETLNTLGEIGRQSKEPVRISVREIAELYALKFSQFQQHMAEREILHPLKLNFDTFIEKQNLMSRDFVLTVKKQLQDYAINAPAIIAGIDHTGPHIYRIGAPGVAHCCDTECFAAIGSGEWHAVSQFMIAGYARTWNAPKTLLLSYSAKRLAQLNAGVGDKTDVFVIGQRGGYTLTKSELAGLDEIWKKKRMRDGRSEKAGYRDTNRYLRALAKKANKKQSEMVSQGASEATSSKEKA